MSITRWVQSWRQTTIANKAVAFASVIVALATVIYAIVSSFQLAALRESNRINRDALETVQRAFLNCTAISAQRVVVRQDHTAHAVWKFTMPCENTGTTPANAVSEALFADKSGKEPAEDEFLGPPFNDVFVLGPRQSGDIGLMTMTELDIFGREFPFSTKEILAWVVPSKTGTPHPPVLWGWVAYYDAFKNSKLHITEFCREMIGISVNQDNAQKPFNLIWHPCEHHNCADEYCDDYKDIASRNSKRR